MGAWRRPRWLASYDGRPVQTRRHRDPWAAPFLDEGAGWRVRRVPAKAPSEVGMAMNRRKRSEWAPETHQCLLGGGDDDDGCDDDGGGG